jgi:flagellar biosynthesis protein FlhA
MASENNVTGKTTTTLIIPVSLIAVLLILLFPLPTQLLDVGLALNITVSLIMLFAALYIERPLSFSSYPAMLLVTTLFRLAMNVATTRLILLYGNEGTDAAGNVVKAFGEFVVGGNFTVGIVIFIAISLVNLKVITKGSSRIAEVAARFTLDAMPGKQMAIDSDLNTGIINDKEARRRRRELEQEAEFYGSMDGAAKFVSGDAVAGVFITGINIVGGFFIGVFQLGMPWLDAATTYTLLTIGDGLVSQIPAIIISTSAGLIVARASSGKDLSLEVIQQLSGSSRPLFLTAGVCFIFALLPGLPFIPFTVLSIASGVFGFLRQQTINEQVSKEKSEVRSAEVADLPKPGSTEEVMKLLSLDTLELEVGFELVALVEGGDLVERIRSIRRQFALEYGFVIPPIHIRDNVRLGGSKYQFLLKGNVIGQGELKTRHLLAMDPGSVSSPILGTPTKEPAFGLEALWINESDRERAQVLGYTVVDLSTVVTTHITEMIKAHMHELLGRQETQLLLDAVAKDAPKVVEELVPTHLSVGQVQQVLIRMLREQISIRDLRTILEVLADHAPTVKHPERLAEYVRRRISRAICAKFVGDEGTLALVSFSPSVERVLSESLQMTDDGSYLGLEPAYAQSIIAKLSQLSSRFAENGQTPLLLAPGHLRAAVASFVERFVPGYSVLGHGEIPAQMKVQSHGVVNVDSRAAAAA